MENFNILGRPEVCFRYRCSSLILAYLLICFLLHCNAFPIEEGKANRGKNNTSTTNKVCKTKGCTDTAKRFLKYMDKSAKACNDFYQFACGNFIKNAILCKGTPGEDMFTIVTETIDEELHSILEANINSNQPRAFKVLQNYYKLCMNTAQVEKNSENDLKQILKSLNGWPVLEGRSWKDSKFDWKNTTYALSKIGVTPDFLMDVFVSIDPLNSTKRILFMDEATLGTDPKYLAKGQNNPIVKAYFKYMVDYAVLLGAKRQVANQELSKVVDFEIEVAKITTSGTGRTDESSTFTKMKIFDLEQNYKGIPWLEYLNNLVKPKKRFTANYQVMVGSDGFFKKIGGLLAKTPKRTLANYIMWSVPDSSLGQMSQRVKDLSKDYNILYAGISERRSRWHDCVDRIHNDMSIATGSMYVRKFFNEQSKKEISMLVKNIRSSFMNIIQKLNWMDPKTKSVALEKLRIMKEHVAYPPELLNNKLIDQIYKNVTIDPKSYLKTQMKFDATSLADNFESLEDPVIESSWLTYGDAAQVNAYYNPTENSIWFPAGILQGHFFAADRPKYLNYGAIGMIIGHEMTHGFDDEGSHYNKYGDIDNWWNSETKKKFDAKAKGIVDQYNKYIIKEINMNVSGKLTVSENIADNGGYKEAYLAYLDSLKKNGPEPILPGLPYTPRQLFWLSAATLWCEKVLPETEKNLVFEDPHSPGKYRVIGPLSNRVEFAADFNCSAGSLMNPVTKYGVW